MPRTRIAALIALSIATVAFGQGGMTQNGLEPAGPDAAPPAVNGPAAAPGNPLAPQQANADWYAPLKVGTKLSYYNATALVRGSVKNMQPDQNGGWPNTGGSSQGYTQATLAFASERGAIFDVRQWLQTPDGAGFRSLPGLPQIATPSMGIDYWRSPAQLAAMPDGAANNGAAQQNVSRLTYEMAGKKFRAIRISDYDETSKSWRTYDLDTGVLLQLSLAVQSKPAMGQRGDPDVQLIHVQFVGAREAPIVVPIKPVPAELQKPRVRMTMSMSMTMPGAMGNPPPAIPMQVTATVQKFDGETIIVKPDGEGVPMLYMATSYYADPQVLARYKQGQMIDEDPIVKSRLYVAEIANGKIAFCEENAAQSVICVYDLRTGLMVGTTKRESIGGGSISETRVEFAYEG